MQHNEGANFLRNITTSWRSIGQVKSLKIQLHNVIMILCSKFLSEQNFPWIWSRATFRQQHIARGTLSQKSAVSLFYIVDWWAAWFLRIITSCEIPPTVHRRISTVLCCKVCCKVGVLVTNKDLSTCMYICVYVCECEYIHACMSGQVSQQQGFADVYVHMYVCEWMWIYSCMPKWAS